MAITCLFLLVKSSDQQASSELAQRKQAVCPRPCKLTFDLLTLKVVPELPVSEMTYTVSSGTLNPSIPYHTCDNYSLPRPLSSRLRPDVRDRQTSDAHHRLLPSTLGAGA